MNTLQGPCYYITIMVHNTFVVYLGNYFRQVMAIGCYLLSLTLESLSVTPSQSGPRESDQAGQSMRGGGGVRHCVIIIVSPQTCKKQKPDYNASYD
jgi:hypothetical protein